MRRAHQLIKLPKHHGSYLENSPLPLPPPHQLQIGVPPPRGNFNGMNTLVADGFKLMTSYEAIILCLSIGRIHKNK